MACALSSFSAETSGGGGCCVLCARTMCFHRLLWSLLEDELCEFGLFLLVVKGLSTQEMLRKERLRFFEGRFVWRGVSGLGETSFFC